MLTRSLAPSRLRDIPRQLSSTLTQSERMAVSTERTVSLLAAQAEQTLESVQIAAIFLAVAGMFAATLLAGRLLTEFGFIVP